MQGGFLKIGGPRTAIRAAVCILAGLVCEPVLAEKTDVVTLRNGDRVTGEIKELTQGLLRYSTDSMSTVYVEWVDVVQLTSQQTFHVELDNGDFYYGSFIEPEQDHHLRISIGEFQAEFDTRDVVAIAPLKEKFWAQFDGNVGLGFQFTKASEVLQWTFTTNAERRKRKFLTRVNLRLSITSKPDAETTRNNTLSYSYTRFLAHRWGAGGSISLQQNDELGIEYRTLLIGSGNRKMIQSTRQRATLSAGLALNNENKTSGDQQQSIEFVAAFLWNVFKYKTPKTDLDFGLSVFPSLTESGRVRAEYNTVLRQELVKDFTVDLTLYFSYDSKPPESAVATSDYGITLSVGYSF